MENFRGKAQFVVVSLPGEDPGGGVGGPFPFTKLYILITWEGTRECAF